MEITISINGRFVSVEVSTEVADYLEQAKRNNRKLYRERQRYWDGHECDEYIIATEGRLPYCATPEELVCQRETLDEILAVLALCTATQRERFLLHALYDFSYAEIAEMCGCSKYAVRDSIVAVRKIFQTFSESDPTIGPLSGYQVRGVRSITGRDKQFRLFVPPVI